MGTDLKDIALMKFSDIENGLWFYNRQKTGEGGLGKPLIILETVKFCELLK